MTDTALIPLTRGYSTIVDADDYDWLMQWKWRAQVLRRSVRAVRTEGRSFILMHRQLLVPPAGLLVDHANRDSLDNRRSNLRICTVSENNRNRRSKLGGSSVYLGVSWHSRTGKWIATAKLEGRNKHLGRFASEIDAALAYDKAAPALSGDATK